MRLVLAVNHISVAAAEGDCRVEDCREEKRHREEDAPRSTNLKEREEKVDGREAPEANEADAPEDAVSLGVETKRIHGSTPICPCGA